MSRPAIPIKPGDVFGQLTVLSFAGRNPSGGYRWNVRCGCGTEKTVSATCLRSGDTRSCGCYRARAARWRARARLGGLRYSVDSSAEDEREFFYEE